MQTSYLRRSQRAVQQSRICLLQLIRSSNVPYVQNHSLGHCKSSVSSTDGNNLVEGTKLELPTASLFFGFMPP